MQEESNQGTNKSFSEYDILLGELRQQLLISNKAAQKEIVEYLLGRYTDDGLPLNVFVNACNEAIEIIRRKEESD